MAGGNVTAAELGAFGMAKETTQGTYVNPTNWLDWTANGIDATQTEIANRRVASGTVMATRINKVHGIIISGPVTYNLGASHGALLFLPTFGANVGLAALTADTVKAATPVVTANGISTITLTNTATVTYVLGAWIQVNTGTSAELRQICTIANNSATSTVVTTAALVTNAAAAAGTAVTQVAQIKFTNAPTSATLPSISIEMNEGNAFSEKLAGCLVEQLSLAADENDVAMTATIVGTVAPVKLSSPTTPAPTAGEAADLISPFSMENADFVVYANPLQGGGSTAAIAQTDNTFINNFKFDWKNNLIRHRTDNRSKLGRYARGVVDLSIAYDFLQVSGEYTEFDQQINAVVNASVPLLFGWSNNQSNTSTAAMRGVGFYVPQARFQKPQYTRATGGVNMASMSLIAEPSGATTDLMQCFVADGTGTAY